MRALAIFAALPPYILWWMAGIALAIVLIGFAIWLAGRIRHLRHDREIEREMQAEAARTAPSVTETASVTVVSTEELPPEGDTVFMPVPGYLSDMTDFVSMEADGVEVRSCIREEDADILLTDEEARRHRRILYRHIPYSEVRAYVTVDTLSGKFAPYSYVNLAILKECGIVDASGESLVIEGGDVLRKPLMIEANSFTTEALKMIALAGGRAVEVRDVSSKN